MLVLVLAVMAVLEPFAAEAGLVQRVALQHRAHGAIEDQDALAQGLFELGDAVGVEPGQGGHGVLSIVRM
jgi:hypothetical protein